MKKRVNPAATELDKQTKPMPGEVDPKDAFVQARVFASLTRKKMKNSGAKFK
jgi:hypothetical protein